MAMQFFSGVAFFASSFYDVGSDYLVSEQFINGAAYIKDVMKQTLLKEYHKRQRRNRGEIYGATSAMVGRNLPPLVGIGFRHLKI